MKKYLFFAVIAAILVTATSCSKNAYPGKERKKLPFVIGTGGECLKNVNTGERAKRHNRYN